MTTPTRTLSRTVTIVNALGLHARAAARIAIIAGRGLGSIWIERGEDRVNATSVIDILTLGCPQGNRVTVIADKADDSDVLTEIVALIQSGFGEPE